MREQTPTANPGFASLTRATVANPPYLPPERLGHDLLAALAGLRIGDAQVAGGRSPEPVGRVARHVPAAGAAGEAAPILGVLRDVGRLVDLLDLGRVLHHEAVRLDEIGEHVVARAVPAQAPLDVETAGLH